jgi:AcrR family transcriptional regulator
MARMTLVARQTLVEERRSQILRAAIRVFAQKGYAAATIRNIAGAAEVAEGTIYNYFRNKEDLLIHIPRHIAGPVFERLTLELPEVHTVEEAEHALVALGSEMVRRVAANVRFVKVFLSAIPHLSPRARKEYLRLLPLAAADVVEAHVRQGIAAGIYRADLDPSIAARALPFMMFMLVIIQEVLSGGRIWPQEYDVMVRENVRLFLNGIRNPKPAQTRHVGGGPGSEAL